MSADIIAIRPRARCGYHHCDKPMVRRSPLNVPAYCCYQHAVEGQPEHAKMTRRNTGDGNDAA